MRARTAARAVAWLAGATALFLAPGLARTMGEGGGLPFEYYLWTSAIPLGCVAAALAWALRRRVEALSRRLVVAAFVALAAYLVVLFASCFGSMRVGYALRWPEWALRYVAWCLWGVLLVVWVLPQRSDVPCSPLDGRPGAEALTEREREIAEALLTGSTQAQVAEALAISPSSVATYRSRACEKLGVASLDELAAPVVGAATVPALGIASSGAIPLVVLALCAGMMLRLLARVAAVGNTSFSQAVGVICVAAVLALPWGAFIAYARLRGMRVRARRVEPGLCAVLLAVLLLGMLVGGGANGLMIPVGSYYVDAGVFASAVYVGAVAALAPHLLWPVNVREETTLDVERCVLYLRGRGAGELQARVLTEIALGRSTPEICEALSVARGTVNAYRVQGYDLLGVHTSRELADLLARDVGRVPSAAKRTPSTDDCETSV